MISIEELKKIQQETLAEVRGRREHVAVAEGVKDPYKYTVLVCGGTGCTSSKSMELYNRFIELRDQNGLTKDINVVRTGCFGLCACGPVVIVYPEGAFYSKIKIEDVDTIFNEHLVNGNIVKNLLYKGSVAEDGSIKALDEINFYKKQRRVVLRNCGVINPEDIKEYIAFNGYQALAKCLTEMTREQVQETILASGLRGRGGAGFPTGLKWKFAMGSTGKKYVCCNADEGDPGAFMDRAVLEGDPHRVLEGMMIAGIAIGASVGVIYVRAEYPLAVSRLEKAIAQLREKGLIGENIRGSGFSFDFRILMGAGAFVCGEETALLASLGGNRGMPVTKPPFPAQQGYKKKPTNINNVETFANVAWIIENGGARFAEMGTENSKGTKVFALAGKVKRGGLVEVPMGITINEIVFGICGGIRDNAKIKAVQMGGPSGGCIPEKLLDTPIDYDSIAKTGAIMGSGGMIVMDEHTCMVDMAKFFMDFTSKESCGKCVPCRIGTTRMLEILERIADGRGEESDLDTLVELGESVKTGALCGLGNSAPNPVLTTIRYFRDEYEAHIKEKRCPAKKCSALIKYVIDEEKCRGCSLCSRNCPVGAISGELKKPFVIDSEKCARCSLCFNSCRFGAIKIISGEASK